MKTIMILLILLFSFVFQHSWPSGAEEAAGGSTNTKQRAGGAFASLGPAVEASLQV